MDNRLAPWTLTWDEVDPGRHRFDADAASGTIAASAPARAVPSRPPGGSRERHVSEWADAGWAWTHSMTLALVEHYGRWVLGWHWAMDEGGGGGPVGSWCCPRHSITTAEETTAKVVQAVTEWRGWLEDLAERFDRYPLTGLSDSDRRHYWERGAVHLVHHVVDRTGAGAAWYRHCAQVLTWFLSRWGVAHDHAERLVDEAIGGRFNSWIEPADTVIDHVAVHMADSAQDVSDGPIGNPGQRTARRDPSR